jgi:hypothetical protein
MPTTVEQSEAAIFRRIFANGIASISRELAQYRLTLGFSEEDLARMPLTPAGPDRHRRGK